MQFNKYTEVGDLNYAKNVSYMQNMQNFAAAPKACLLCMQKYAKHKHKYAEYASMKFIHKICKVYALHFADGASVS